jgi:hypothetical protein
MSVLKKIFTGTAIAAAALAPLAGTAQAGDWSHGRGYGSGYGHRAPAYGYHRPAPHYGYAERRDRRGERIATGVAIGVGALILGSILAHEARRNNHYRGY